MVILITNFTHDSTTHHTEKHKHRKSRVCVFTTPQSRTPHSRTNPDPKYLEYIQADSSGGRRHVGVPQFGDEAHLGGLEGVRRRHVDVQQEASALVGGVGGPGDVAPQLGPGVDARPHAHGLRPRGAFALAVAPVVAHLEQLALDAVHRRVDSHLRRALRRPARRSCQMWGMLGERALVAAVCMPGVVRGCAFRLFGFASESNKIGSRPAQGAG